MNASVDPTVMPAMECIDMGRASYDRALALQQHLVRRVQQRGGTYLLLVEHDPPVITLGRRGAREHVLANDSQLAAEGIQVRRSTRGGQVTYHGPGQLVAYAVRRIGPRGRTLHGHVHQLEETVIRLLRRFDIDAARRPGRIGVWAGDRKIAAVGVAMERWVCYHGLALNVTTDLSRFALIVPCGQADASVTSMAATLGRPVAIADVKPRLLHCFQDVFGFEKCECPVTHELTAPHMHQDASA